MVDECFLRMSTTLQLNAGDDIEYTIKAEKLILQYHISKLVLLILLKAKFPSCSPKHLLAFQCNGSQKLAASIFEYTCKYTDACNREVLHNIACNLIGDVKEGKYDLAFLCDEVSAIANLTPR